MQTTLFWSCVYFLLLFFKFLGLWSLKVWEPLVYMSFDPVIQVLGNDPPEIMCDIRKTL